MLLSTWYWLCLFLFILCGVWWGVVTPPPGRFPVAGWSFLLLILLFLLGLKTMGSPIKG